MVKLQRPQWVYFNGGIRPYEEAVIHVSAEAVYRGLNVFEGVKGYWQATGGDFGLVALPRHYARLRRSAQLLHIPVPVHYEQFEKACHDLIRALCESGRDMWIRATLYVIEGHWGEGTRADLVLAAYHQDNQPPAPVQIGVSTWQRASDVTLPARIKTSTNYQVARLARIEGRGRGFSEMVLLNQWGRVAEATGACILMVRDGLVVTPPATEGALESITLQIVLALARSMGIPTEVRPVDRTELYVCDEMALAGSLAEVAAVRRIDDYTLPEERPILQALQDRFFAAVRGHDPHPAADLSIVHNAAERSLTVQAKTR
jgi:branched-chain amino acid aminotransferase